MRVDNAARIASEALAVFANAEVAKTEVTWLAAVNAAKAVEIAWNKVVEANEQIMLTTSGTTEEEKAILAIAIESAKSQKEFWLLKVALAEAEANVIRSNMSYLAAIAKTRGIWAFLSRAMKIFINNPNEINLNDVMTAAKSAENSVDITKRTIGNGHAHDKMTLIFLRAAANYASSASSVHRYYVLPNNGANVPKDLLWVKDIMQEAADFAKAAAVFKGVSAIPETANCIIL